MKNTIFFLLLISIQVKGQEQKIVELPPQTMTKITGVGDELIKARDDFYFGTSFMVFGALLVASPSVLPVRSDGPEAASLRIGGGMMMVTGAVFQVLAWSHFGKAGELMNGHRLSLSAGGDGIGIAYKF